MKRVEKLARERLARIMEEAVLAGMPEADVLERGTGFVMGFEEAYRMAIEDAANICDQGDGAMSSISETIQGNAFRDQIRRLADREED